MALACLGERLPGSDTQASPEHPLHVPLPAFSCTFTPCTTCHSQQRRVGLSSLRGDLWEEFDRCSIPTPAHPGLDVGLYWRVYDFRHIPRRLDVPWTHVSTSFSLSTVARGARAMDLIDNARKLRLKAISEFRFGNRFQQIVGLPQISLSTYKAR